VRLYIEIKHLKLKMIKFITPTKIIFLIPIKIQQLPSMGPEILIRLGIRDSLQPGYTSLTMDPENQIIKPKLDFLQ
jgi:hypothetical protein